MTDRILSSCQHKWASSNCKKCGVYDHPNDPVLKTNYYESYLNTSAPKYIKHMRKRQSKQIYNRQISESTFSLLESICQKFQYSIETLALGVYLYAKTCQKNNKDEKFWASAALIVASKGIQLDKRVPYLNRYQRYADKSFSQEQYEQAQRTIFEDLEFDVQYTTFVSFLHFYLTSGVLFKSDSFNPAILKYIEDDMMSKARDYIKTGEFLPYDPEKLALSIVKDIRVKFRLEPWKKQLELISGFTESQIESGQPSHSILKPVTQISQKQKEKQKQLFCQTLRTHQRQPLCLNPLSLNFLQNSLNLQQKQKQKPIKKCQQTLKNTSVQSQSQIKQNSSKILQDIPQSLASLRNQVTNHCNSSMSMSTNLNMNMSYGSKYGERLATVSSFVTSRRF